MILHQLKLKITKTQDKLLGNWLWCLTGAWNTAIRRIGQDAKYGIYYSRFDLQNQVTGHSERLGIPAHVLQAVFAGAHAAWDRCFKKLSKAPRLKSIRRPFNSIPFPDSVKPPVGNRITLLGIGKVRFHKQDIPKGKIKCVRVIKRASGWYLCLFIDAQRAPIRRIEDRGVVGIDPGFKDLLTLSDGTKIPHPQELEAGAKRLAQAQRGHRKNLTSRLYERTTNQKKDRNHKLSLWLVQNYSTIYFSKDHIGGIAKRFGKSVNSSNHYQLRQMLKYKCLAGGTSYNEVESKFSTKTCSSCGAHSGPTGLAGLSVRFWTCSCGAEHDRDINAAINTLKTGSGRDHERAVTARQEAEGDSARHHAGRRVVNKPIDIDASRA
jgi:putative transposase